MTTPIPNKRFPARWAFAAILVVSFSLNVFSCSKDKPRDETQLLEGLPPEFVELLVAGDNAGLQDYARGRGFEAFHGLYAEIGTREYKLWADGRRKDALVLEDYLARLAPVFSVPFHDSSYTNDIRFLRSLPEDKRTRLRDARSRYPSGQDFSKLPTQTRIDELTRFMARLDSLGDREWAARAKNDLSDLYSNIPDTTRQRQYLVDAVADFVSLGRNKMACETLGKLGSRYERWGSIDSMAICYEHALAIANRHRMGYQAARIYEFYGGYYSRLGRLDIKQKLLERSMNIARTYDPGCYEIRFIKEAVKFNAKLGCWDVVDRLIDRVHGVVPDCDNLETFYDEVNQLRTDVYEARLEMANGNVARADSIFREANRRLPALGLPSTYVAEDDEYSYYRAEGLLANGKPAEALEEASGKLAEPPTKSIPLWSARLSLIAAKAAYEIGDMAQTTRRIADFDRYAVGEKSDLRAELCERDALVAMAALARADTAGAAAAVAKGLAALRATADSLDASVGSYLWIADSDELRQALHAVTGNDALAGYGAEFCWREAYSLLGSRERRGTVTRGARCAPSETAREGDGSKLVKAVRSTGRQVLASTARLGAIHCVYHVRDKDVWRWTAARGAVRKDMLSISTAELRGLVSETTALLSKDPGDLDAPPDRQLRAHLRELARALLPPELFDSPVSPAGTPLFLVTADGFLGTIPFGALDAGGQTEYEPLLEKCDVAFVRLVRSDAIEPAGGPGVILTASDSSRGSRRGIPTLGELREAEKEGRALAALDPSARLLAGGEATKGRLKKHWEDAPYLYIAAHTSWVELPYLTAAVLAVPTDDQTPDADILDLTDIRGADLRRCRLVVLSACASGSPYPASKGAAPSLGDAFLDAGAAAVIHTFWDVRDEDARRIGSAFVTRWKVAKQSEIHALAEAGRAEIRGPKGVRHPFRWANFAITVSRL